MKTRIFLCSLLAGVAWVAPTTSPAMSDNYSSGFYTRGVDAATYMDQGSAILDPFYLPAKEFSFLPRISLEVVHEDNIFLDPVDPKQGTSVRVVPGVMGIWGRPGKNHLYADYGLILPVYESEQELDDTPSHLLRLGTVYRTGKSQAQAELGYRLSQDNIDTVLGARVGQEDYFGDLNLETRISGKSSVGAVGRVEVHDYEDDFYGDYNRYYGGGRLYHRVTPKSEGFVQAGVGRDDPQEPAYAANAADFYDLSLGVRGKQSPKFNSSGRVGYMWRQYDEEGRGDLGQWIASLQAESNPFGLTTFSGELYADVRPAIDTAGLDTVDQGVVGRIHRRLFIERLRGNASATVGQIDYHGDGPAGPGADGRLAYDGRTDDYWGFSLGVDWWTKERFSIGLAYSYMRRNGSQDADEGLQERTSYEYARWNLRASWNY